MKWGGTTELWEVLNNVTVPGVSVSSPGRGGRTRRNKADPSPFGEDMVPPGVLSQKDQVLDPCGQQQGWALCPAGNHTSTHNSPRGHRDFY